MDVRSLGDVPLFATLSKRERKRLVQCGMPLEIDEGTPVVRSGEFGHELFVIEEGTVGVMRGNDEVATLGAGDIIGEMAVESLERRGATAIAKSPLRVIVFSRRDFRALEHEIPRLRAAVAETIERRNAALEGAAEPAESGGR